MALEKQTIGIPLAQGMDSKSDIKQLPVGKLSLLTNGSFKTPGSIQKRYGKAALSQSIIGGGSISNGKNINNFQNELNVLGSSTLYSYSDSQLSWVNKGFFPTLSISALSVARNTYEQTNQSSAVHSSGLRVFVWEDSSGGVRYSVVDSTTGNAIINNNQLDSDGQMPRVNIVGTNFVLTYYDGANIVYRAISTSTPATLGSPVNIATDVNVSDLTETPIFDTAVINSRVYIAYNSSNPGLAIYYLDSSLVLSSKYTNNTDAVDYRSLSVFGDGSNQVWVSYSTSSNVRVVIAQANLGGTVLAPTTLEAVSATRITGIVASTTATIYYEISANDPWFHYVRSNTMTQAGSAGTPVNFMLQHGLGSKVFAVSGVNYLFLSHESSLQPTYFLFNASGVVVSKFALDLGGGLPVKMQLPEINLVSSNLYQWSYLEKELPTASDGQVISTRGVMSGVINFNPSFVQTQNAGKNLLSNGGISQMYDGATPVEQGFHLSPENLTGDYTPTGGGLGSGQYQYCAVYEWIDNQGQRHRSAPSPALTVVTSDQHKVKITADWTLGDDDFINASPDTGTLYLNEAIEGAGVADLVIDAITTTTAFSTVGNATETHTGDILTPSNTGSIQLISYNPHDYPLTSNQMRLLPDNPTGDQLYIYGYTTDGSNQVVIDGDVSWLKVGYTLWPQDNPGTPVFFVAGSLKVTAISGFTITVDSTATETSYVVFKILPITAMVSLTSGNPTITGLTTTETAWFEIGDGVAANGPGIPLGAQVLSKTSTTITMNMNADMTTSVEIFRSWNPPELIKVGQTASVLVGDGNSFIETVLTDIQLVNEEPYGGITGYIATFLDPIYGGAFAVNFSPVYGSKITVPNLPATLKLSPRTPVSIALYRTVANGTIFYRTSSAVVLTYNDPSVDTVTFLDTTPDYALVGNEVLYTSSGEVENDPLPATNYLATYKNRIIGIPSENPLTWWYSKQCIPGSPPEFSLSFVNNIDQRIKEIVACSYMDDKFVFFGPKSIFYMVGDGPAASGLNNDFSEPQIIASDTGCSEAPSVILSPVGIFFKSVKGICLLTRALEVSYIGSDVEAYNSLSITSSILVDAQNQIRFTLSNGTQITYDYFMNQWDVDSNPSAVSSVLYNSRANYLTSAGIVLQETPDLYTDNTAAISLGVNTGWMSLANVQGFQRVWKLLILGTYRSPHTLNVSIYYDFDDTTPQTVPIPVLSNPGNYEFRVFLTRQKSTAIKIVISDTPSSPLGEGFSLSNLALEIGVKKGLNKIKATSSYG